MMKINVHILATCLNPALIEATLLVFKTLRTGFPENPVCVWENGLAPFESSSVRLAASNTQSALRCLLQRTQHDKWIAHLLEKSTEPFWVCDTDMVFFDAVPCPAEGTYLMGRYEPTFKEPWTKTSRVSRLHTCLLYLDPILIRQKTLEWAKQWQPMDFPFTPQFELIAQHFVPQGKGNPPLFYDTCAGLYQAIGGTSFNDEQNAAFGHLHCGTYSDRIEKALPEAARARDLVLDNPSNARGLFASQEEYYRNHPANMVET